MKLITILLVFMFSTFITAFPKNRIYSINKNIDQIYKRYLKTTSLKYKKFSEYEASSSNQKTYIDSLDNINYKMLIANGPAGTGKTLLACQSAIKQLSDGDIDKIIITRPVVPVGEDLGFLPEP